MLPIAWTLFAAASVTNTSVRDQLIRGVWNRANSNATVGPFLNYYSNNNGSAQQYSGAAGPSLGAMFAPLALTWVLLFPEVALMTDFLSQSP